MHVQANIKYLGYINQRTKERENSSKNDQGFSGESKSLTQRSRVLIVKPISDELVKNFTTFLEPENLLLLSQVTANSP